MFLWPVKRVCICVDEWCACRRVLDYQVRQKIPIAWYLATKFWMYYTWFLYFWPCILVTNYHHPECCRFVFVKLLRRVDIWPRNTRSKFGLNPGLDLCRGMYVSRTAVLLTFARCCHQWFTELQELYAVWVRTSRKLFKSIDFGMVVKW